ncbi:MAG: hypothetical protein AAFV29_22815 [Myxococcota bacterium]
MIADAERRGYQPFADYWRRTLEEVLRQPEFDLELQGRPVAEPAQAELDLVLGD